MRYVFSQPRCPPVGASWHSYMMRSRRSPWSGTTTRDVSPATAVYFSKPLWTVYLSVEDRYTAGNLLRDWRDGCERCSIKRTITGLYALRMSSNKADDGTLDVNTATVVGPVSGCAAGSKSGRRDRASATTFSRPGLYSTKKLYYANIGIHLAICCERCGLLTAVRKDAWSE